MKKILAIILVILILGIGGYFLFDYLSKPKLISSNSEPVSVCSDTDGNNIYEKGYSAYKYPDGTQRGKDDVCDYFNPKTKSRVGLVREGYCDGNNFKTELWSCGRGHICRNGRCLKGTENSPICSDTVGGIEPNKRGEIYGSGGSGTDDCWITMNKDNPELDGGYGPDCAGANCYVYEYYCSSDGDTKEHKIISCTNGCLNGACK
jgi:hypothetical protein